MKIDLRPDENVIKEAAANVQRGMETVGGRLFLTNQRLYFNSHAFNLATGEESLELADIGSVQPTWTNFLGVVPIFPNSIRITTKSGQTFDFVVWGRGA